MAALGQGMSTGHGMDAKVRPRAWGISVRQPRLLMPWIIFVVLLSLVFPMQVEFDNANMGLVPYVWLAPFLLFRFLFPARQAPALAPTRKTAIDTIVFLYLCLFVVKETLAALVGVVEPALYFRTLFIYVLPVGFYYYVKSSASDREIRSILAGIVIAAAIIGGYWVYDTVLKAHFHEVSDFQRMALDYTNKRGDVRFEDSNQFRIIEGYRSWGLLGRHSFSAAWIGFGVFAALALIRRGARGLRRIAWCLGASVLLIGQNFSGIFAFAVTSVLLYRRPRRRRLRLRAPPMWAVLSVMVLLSASLYLEFDWATNVFEKMSATAVGKIGDVFGDPDLQWTAASGLKIDTLRYVAFLWRHPYAFSIGELHGGPAMEFEKGGDFGFLDDMAVVGIPFFLLVAAALAVACWRFRQWSARRAASDAEDNSTTYYQGALAMVLSLALMEIHYTVVFEKCLFPIAAIALGLMSRYPLQSRPHQASALR